MGGQIINKARYTATQVASWWAGVITMHWAGVVMQQPLVNAKKVKFDLWSDGQMDKLGC